jgi:hypothetical protein
MKCFQIIIKYYDYFFNIMPETKKIYEKIFLYYLMIKIHI